MILASPEGKEQLGGHLVFVEVVGSLCPPQSKHINPQESVSGEVSRSQLSMVAKNLDLPHLPHQQGLFQPVKAKSANSTLGNHRSFWRETLRFTLGNTIPGRPLTFRKGVREETCPARMVDAQGPFCKPQSMGSWAAQPLNVHGAPPTPDPCSIPNGRQAQWVSPNAKRLFPPQSPPKFHWWLMGTHRV